MGVTLSRLCSVFPETGPVHAEENLDLIYLLFRCRVNAIQTLYKEKIEFTSDVDSTQWTSISEMISESYQLLSDERLKGLREKWDSGDIMARRLIVETSTEVSKAFDADLLGHLQLKVDLMKKLKDYLPDHGPMLEEFVRDIDNESKTILQNVQPNAVLEDLFTFKELTGKLMSEDPKKSGESQSTPSERKIAVFNATDRVWRDGHHGTEAGPFHYGVQYVSIPGGHEIGKVESGGGDGSTNFVIGPIYEPWREPNKFLDKIKEQCAQNSLSANDVASSSAGPQKVIVHKQ
ncbi:unnamed protein product [Sphagnum balticum]